MPTDRRVQSDPVRPEVRLLHRRKVAARVLVLVTAACLLLGIPLSLFDRRGLALLLAVFGVYFLFLLVDCGLVGTWRRRLLRAWQAGDVNLAVFAGAVATLPTLPHATLAAMLRSLPILTPVQDRDLDPASRAALAAFSDWRWTERNAAALLPSAVLALVSGTAAAMCWAWVAPDARTAAILLALLAGLVLLRFGLPLWRHGRYVRRLPALTADAADAWPGLVASLDQAYSAAATSRTVPLPLGSRGAASRATKSGTAAGGSGLP